MKKFILPLILVLTASSLHGQVDSLVRVGIQYHDNGEYNKAIKVFRNALEIAPNSALVNYEIALSYLEAKDYESSIRHSNKVIDLNDRYVLQAYLTKGSSLDYQGHTKKSIRLFEKGLKEFGPHYLLYYNLGYNYYKIKDFEAAEVALTNAINENPGHGSSHLLLGSLMSDLKKRSQSLLNLHYFLFLEPNTHRSKIAFSLLREQFGGNVQINQDKPREINIFLDPNQADSEFGAADLMVSMLEVSKNLEENKGKTEDELFIENTQSFFKILGELKKKKNKGLWWEFYVPFFYEIAKSEHINTYCYYISQSFNESAIEWLAKNKDKRESFDQWLRSVKW